jgi:hypothetical protein
MSWWRKLFGSSSQHVVLNLGSTPIVGRAKGKGTICKAYKNGRCISQQTGADTGPCSWRPADWQNCAVVDECRKFYGKW